MGGVDSIVVEEEGITEMEEPQGKTIVLKDLKDPLVSNTRKGCQEVPEGQDGLEREGVVVALGPADTININNVKNELSIFDEASLNKGGPFCDNVLKL